jgi:type I restriction-modification system DNA methylase subunit
MINKDNLKSLLGVLSFEPEGDVFTKKFDDINAVLKVDFNKQELIYPEDKGLVVNQRQTCNFSDNENFVVFECVNRLFEKGYKPEHIELEPKWKVGHGASGGRADILVKDNSGKALLIIECKTEGREFNDAWRKAQNGVSQLLTYAQQQRSTKYLCLYASDLVGNKAVYNNYILTLIDNEKLLEEKKDLKPLTYKEAEEVEDLFKVWKETYALDYATKGIFESDIQPYHIGKLKYTSDDLDTVNSDKEIQSKYHEFATILRQHNVSGRENAFDKLVNLFLCKIVDESRNSSDLKFYWKGIAYDSPFDLQDRLQKLYKDGMNEFLGEDVTYIDEQTIKNAFHFVKEKPDATRQKILGYFRELKFFTNNDFAFIDVHNENLFHQNFEVLLKIVKMLQDLRLQSEQQNQFLGDMFEGFLDQGVKQSEGQFFTPSPITKFIMLSLPLEKMIESSEKPPRAIDYACGSGHFLNELAMQIKPFVEKHNKGDIKDFYNQIYGIEKEYRLSKVAKVSAFMYGQNQIHIIYGDALAQLDKNKHKAAGEIKNDSFDILTANPPYSVKGFLETLRETERAQYKMVDTIEEKSFANNNAIETFFVERAKQLLRPNGVAGIIAPSSILNKGNQKYPVRKQNSYVATREILLKYFDIIGIVELASKTFGKTGTKTVVLFLRRKDENPAPAEHYQVRVEDWFSGDGNQAIFADAHFIENYCNHIGIDFEHYKTLLTGKPNKDLLDYEIFQDYQKEFDNLSEIKNLKKATVFKKKTAEEKKVELAKKFLDFIREIEKDKLYYFTLASENNQKVVVIKSPTDNDGQKEFLGYEWSSAKGNEGIKYFASTYIAPAPLEGDEEDADAETERLVENLNNLSRIKTTLYDPNDRENPEKLNTYIQRNFNGESFTVPESLAPVLSTVRLVDMLDFTRTDFNKAISSTPKQSIVPMETKWKLEKLSSVVEIIGGGTPNTSNPAYWNGDIPWLSVGDFNNEHRYVSQSEKTITKAGLDNSSTKYLEVGDLIISARGTVGALAQLAVRMTFNQSCYGLRAKSDIDAGYLYYILKKEINQLKANAYGSKFDSITTRTFDDIKIPLPPKDEVQIKIVKEIEYIEKNKEKYFSQGMSIQEFEKHLEELKDEVLKKYL